MCSSVGIATDYDHNQACNGNTLPFTIYDGLVFVDEISFTSIKFAFNTLRTGDADLRFYITTVQDG